MKDDMAIADYGDEHKKWACADCGYEQGDWP